jgi:nucleotide-binding universal stress UspA family protein
MFKNILLAADGSIHSQRAAEKAVQLALLQTGSIITVVYVIDGQTSKEDLLHHYDKSVVQEKRRKRLESVELLLNQNHINYEMKHLHGEPGPTIVDFANQNQFDIVVLGSRGLNTLQEMVLGSVSHKVAKRVKAPVLLVK